MSSIRISPSRGFPLFGRTIEDTLGSLGFLVIRLVFGLGIIQHGLPKIQNPFHWADKMGLPSFLQFLAAISEFGGGLAIIFGLLTRLGSLGIVITMATAILKAHAGAPFVSNNKGPSFELAALYGAVALCLVLAGPGRFSLDRVFFGPRD